MKNEIVAQNYDFDTMNIQTLYNLEYPTSFLDIPKSVLLIPKQVESKKLAEILFITSYPPRECGIATYSQDLIKSLNNKFSKSLSIKVCALESGDVNYTYPIEVESI